MAFTKEILISFNLIKFEFFFWRGVRVQFTKEQDRFHFKDSTSTVDSVEVWFELCYAEESRISTS